MTRAHGCKEQRSGVTTQDRRAPPARATNPRTGLRLTQKQAGFNPRTGQAAVIFLLCRHLRVLPRLWRFCVRGRMRQCYNGLGLGISVLGMAFGWFIAYLFFSSAPFHRSRLLCASTSHFPLQLQEQKTRVEQWMRKVSVVFHVATELRECSSSIPGGLSTAAVIVL